MINLKKIANKAKEAWNDHVWDRDQDGIGLRDEIGATILEVTQKRNQSEGQDKKSDNIQNSDSYASGAYKEVALKETKKGGEEFHRSSTGAIEWSALEPSSKRVERLQKALRNFSNDEVFNIGVDNSFGDETKDAFASALEDIASRSPYTEEALHKMPVGQIISLIKQYSGGNTPGGTVVTTQISAPQGGNFTNKDETIALEDESSHVDSSEAIAQQIIEQILSKKNNPSPDDIFALIKENGITDPGAGQLIIYALSDAEKRGKAKDNWDNNPDFIAETAEFVFSGLENEHERGLSASTLNVEKEKFTSRGDDVRALQIELQEKGFLPDGKSLLDGIRGPMTDLAIENAGKELKAQGIDPRSMNQYDFTKAIALLPKGEYILPEAPFPEDLFNQREIAHAPMEHLSPPKIPEPSSPPEIEPVSTESSRPEKIQFELSSISLNDIRNGETLSWNRDSGVMLQSTFIADLQVQLNQWILENNIAVAQIPVDEKFGDLTKNALQLYQQSHNLVSAEYPKGSGIIDARVVDSIFSQV